MKKHIKFILVLFFASLIYPAIGNAGKNPIKWSLNRDFQVPLITGRTYVITYTFTNQIPLTLVKPINISKSASPASEFSYIDNCSGRLLQTNETCTVDITLTPLISGDKSLQLTIDGFDKNQVNLPLVTTISIGGVVGGIVGGAAPSLPYQINLGNSETYTFTFTNEDETIATNVIGSVTQSNGVSANIVANTCGTSGSPGSIATKSNNGSCYITGSFNASTLGEQTVTASLSFDGVSGSPVSVPIYTTVVNSGQDGDVVGSLVTPYYLPPVMTQSTTFVNKFLFTNVSSSTVDFSGSNVGTVSCLANGVSCGTCSSSACTGQISSFSSNCIDNLPSATPSAACELQATFTSPTATDPVSSYTLTATLPYSVGGTAQPDATVSTSGSVLSALPTTRTITLTNQCGFDVWFSLHGASVAGSCSTTTGLGCPSGTSCYQTNGTCFWTNPTPNSAAGSGLAAYGLSANGGSNSVTIPAYDYGGVQWSGNISASLNCNNSSSCAQASCGNAGGSTSCSPGIGFTQPSTLAEITMNVSSSDSYDIGTINGFHIPITMIPIYYIDPSTQAATPATPDNYTCGSPGQIGSSATNNGFGSCDWSTVSLPNPSGGTGKSSGYYWVTKGGSACNIADASNQCGSQLCGVAIDTSTNALTTVCGDFLGYWTGDQVCSYGSIPSSIETFFGCSTKLSTLSAASSLPFPSGATLYELMKCHVPPNDPNPLYNSCYNSYPSSSTSQIQTCCGCVDWWDSSIDSNPNTQSCGTQIDPVWTQYIQPSVQWMKTACPSSYVYPFDDKTSGFSCSNNLPNQPNSVDYEIIFCNGNSGLPTGITEGR